MSSNEMLPLQELGRRIHQRVNQKFEGQEIPHESVSENFLRQIVQTILEDLYESGDIPVIPSFKVLNKSSMEERFSGNVPDFHKHINLFGLDKQSSHNELGTMNVAIDGESAEKYQQMLQEAKSSSSPAPDPAPPAEQPEESPSDEEPSPMERRRQFTVIEGGKE